MGPCSFPVSLSRVSVGGGSRAGRGRAGWSSGGTAPLKDGDTEPQSSAAPEERCSGAGGTGPFPPHTPPCLLLPTSSWEPLSGACGHCQGQRVCAWAHHRLQLQAQRVTGAWRTPGVETMPQLLGPPRSRSRACLADLRPRLRRQHSWGSRPASSRAACAPRKHAHSTKKGIN